MKVLIISVGDKSKPASSSLINEFTGRLPKNIKLSWLYIKHGHGSNEQSKQQEAELILRNLPNNSRVILLDEKGEQFSSTQFSKMLFTGGDITFVIGGAYGVTNAVRNKSDIVWSLGMLVFPHQIVRLMLAEQIYRAYAIHENHPYHHA